MMPHVEMMLYRDRHRDLVRQSERERLRYQGQPSHKGSYLRKLVSLLGLFLVL
jgi:hypothetical protein